MILYPKAYFKNVREIDIEFLKKNNIKGIILDVDNTLINYYKEFEQGTEQWVKNMKGQGIKLCIVSNTNRLEKVKMVARKLELPYFYFAKKPFKFGFLKAKKVMNLKNENIAAVGDQLFTDVIGANRCKMFSILVDPIEEKDIWITRLKRPIEKKIINKYLKKVEEVNKKNVHK